jgi:hypothetical protein
MSGAADTRRRDGRRWDHDQAPSPRIIAEVRLTTQARNLLTDSAKKSGLPARPFHHGQRPTNAPTMRLS